jgi:hypothetical protein
MKVSFHFNALFFLLILVFPSITLARLGETEQDNRARYGNSVKESSMLLTILKNAENKTYHFQGWKIRVGYLNGHAVRIAYSKLPKPNETPQLREDEIEAVLNAEAHEGQWKKLRAASLFSIKNSGNKMFDHAPFRWINTNKCIAYSPIGRMIIYIESQEAIVWEQAMEIEREVKRKESIPQF